MIESRPGVASRLAGQSGLVLLGNLFTLLVGLPFQIYLSRMLGPTQLGAFGLFEVIAQTAASLGSCGLSYAVVRFIPQHLGLGENRHVRQLLKTVFLATLLIGFGLSVLVVVGSSTLARWMPELQAYSMLFPFAGALVLLIMLTGLAAQALRGFLDIRQMILVASFLQLALKIGFTFVLLWQGWEILGYLVAVVASTALSLAGMLWGLRRHIRRMEHTKEKLRPEIRKDWWSYSRTMYVSSLLGMGVAPVERFLLARSIDLSSVGIWMVVRQLQSLPQVLLQVIITVIAPMLVAAKAKDDMDEAAHLYHIATDWVCRLGLPLLIFLLVFGYDVLRLYGAAFAEAGHWPLLVMIGAQLVNLATGPVGAVLYMLGQEKRLLHNSLLSDSLLFLCLLTLAPLMGLLGVALASILSTLALKLPALRLMKQELGIGWWSKRYQRLFLPSACALVPALFANYLGFVHNAWILGVTLVAIYGIFAIGYLSSGLSPEDREIYSMLRTNLGLADAKN